MKIKYIIVSLTVLLLIFIVWFSYPYLFSLYINFFCSRALPKYDSTTVGTFGDMFGALNTLFAGLGIFGLVITIFLQIHLHEKEIKQKNEKETEKQRSELIYLESLFIDGIAIATDYIQAYTGFKNSLEATPFEIPKFNNTRLSVFLSTLNDKIDQEKYFLAYRKYYNDSELITAFGNFKLIQVLCMNITQLIQDKNTSYHEKKGFLTNNLNSFLVMFKENVDNIIDQGQTKHPLTDIYLQYQKYGTDDKSDLNKFKTEIVDPTNVFLKSVHQFRLNNSYSDDLLNISGKIIEFFKQIESNNLQVLSEIDVLIIKLNEALEQVETFTNNKIGAIPNLMTTVIA